MITNLILIIDILIGNNDLALREGTQCLLFVTKRIKYISYFSEVRSLLDCFVKNANNTTLNLIKFTKFNTSKLMRHNWDVEKFPGGRKMTEKNIWDRPSYEIVDGIG